MARVRGKYREMPGLCLTLPQVCRLWQIEPSQCRSILDSLVAEKFLSRTTEVHSLRHDFAARNRATSTRCRPINLTR
jgi:hypothetical protein